MSAVAIMQTAFGRRADRRASGRRACRRRAFTLPEVLIASVVLAFAVVALTQAIVAGQMQTYDALHRERAAALAEAMVEEVLSKPYNDPDGDSTPGPENGESERDAFDNVDDYHGFSESAGSVSDRAGSAYPDAYDPFARSVTVEQSTVSINPLGDRTGLMVTVTVTDESGGSWSASRFVSDSSSSGDSGGDGGSDGNDGEEDDEDDDDEDDDEDDDDDSGPPWGGGGPPWGGGGPPF